MLTKFMTGASTTGEAGNTTSSKTVVKYTGANDSSQAGQAAPEGIAQLMAALRTPGSVHVARDPWAAPGAEQ